MLEFILNIFRRFSLVGAAYNVFVKSVASKAASLQNADNVKDTFLVLRKNNNKAEAYVVRIYTDDRKTQTNLNESIDIELLPKELQADLNNNGTCRFEIESKQ